MELRNKTIELQISWWTYDELDTVIEAFIVDEVCEGSLLSLIMVSEKGVEPIQMEQQWESASLLQISSELRCKWPLFAVW